MNLSESYKTRIQELGGISPSDADLENLIYNNEGIFSLENVRQFAKKFLNYDITKEVGEGNNGASYLTSKNTKLKFSFSISEFDFVRQHINQKNDFMADYYKVKSFGEDKLFVIEMEYLHSLPEETKLQLKETLRCMIKNETCKYPNIESRIKYIVSKLSGDANDCWNFENYGLKNNLITIFDPSA